MYRCRRIISILLSLAVVASTFIIFASAEESEYADFRLVAYNGVNNVEYPIDNGSGFNFALDSGAEYTLDIRSLYPKSNTVFPNTGLAVNFSLRLHVYYDGNIYPHDMSPMNIRKTTDTAYNVSGEGIFRWIGYVDYDYAFHPDMYNLSPYGFQGSFIFYNNTTKNLNTTVVIHNYSQTRVQCRLYFEDVSITSDINWFFSSILNPALNSITNSLIVQNTKLFSDSFSYTEISYDANGNSSSVERSGNWITAIWGELKSLVAPVKNQVEQEQKAKDAGAYDALDDAFDSAGSSFGSLGDFGTVSDIAPFNPGSFDNNAQVNILDWFSSETRDNIDTVPRTRANEVQVIDFYNSHINQYLQEVEPDDTAD